MEWMNLSMNLSKICGGTVDTMLTSPDFVEDFEREKVLNFAPAENNHPISVSKTMQYRIVKSYNQFQKGLRHH